MSLVLDSSTIWKHDATQPDEKHKTSRLKFNLIMGYKLKKKKKMQTLKANRFKLSHSKSFLQYADRT